jgi:hypothetical protein
MRNRRSQGATRAHSYRNIWGFGQQVGDLPRYGGYVELDLSTTCGATEFSENAPSTTT